MPVGRLRQQARDVVGAFSGGLAGPDIHAAARRQRLHHFGSGEMVLNVSQSFGRKRTVGQHEAILPDDGDSKASLLAEFTDGGMKQGGRNGRTGLIEQRSECHGGQAAAGLQHFRHATEFGLLNRADHQPPCDGEADDDGGERAEGDFPPDAEVHVGMSVSRNL
jgi:hypothetical protein